MTHHVARPACRSERGGINKRGESMVSHANTVWAIRQRMRQAGEQEKGTERITAASAAIVVRTPASRAVTVVLNKQ